MLKGTHVHSACRRLHVWLNQGRRGVLLGVVLCLLTGATISAIYLHGKDVRTFRMWQSWYSPAVGMACGYGYTFLPSYPGDQLEQFLAAKAQTFDCSKALSPDKYPPVAGGSECQYLIGLVGELWQITGPDWNAVKLVIGLIYALMAVAAFLLARTVLNSTFAAGVTLIFVASPATMEMMTRLRDLGKAPFILGACAVLLWLIGSYSRRWLGIVILLGVVVGIGYGFRPDILMLLPIGVLLIATLMPREIVWYERIAAIAVMIGVFIICASPLLFFTYHARPSALSHAVVLGLSPFSNYNLGVQPGNYSWGINQADRSVLEALNAYAALKYPDMKQMLYMHSAYEKAGESYLLSMLKEFPADMALRVEASAVSLTSDSVSHALWLGESHAARGVWLVALLFVVVAGIFCVGYRNRRTALGFGLLFAYLVAIMALQFEHRHHFYMELFVLMALAALLDFAVTARFRPAPRSLAIILGGSALLLVSVVVFQKGLQSAQTLWITPRLRAFVDSPRESLTAVTARKGMTNVTFPQLAGTGDKVLPLYPETPQPAYPLVMTIDQSRCGSSWRYFRVDYGTLDFLGYTFWIQPYPRSKFGVWSEEFILPNISALGHEIEVTVPLYRDGAALREIQLSPGLANCVIKWQRLHSNDALFDLMNWVVDKPEHLIPFRLEFDKPRPN